MQLLNAPLSAVYNLLFVCHFSVLSEKLYKGKDKLKELVHELLVL